MIYRLAIVMAGMALPSLAMAQTRELHRDREQIRDAERDMDRAQRYGEYRHVRQARENLRDAHRDYRDDWRDYRDRNRGLYARGDWRAPFRYEHFATGATLRRGYYEPRYFIADYHRYRLPAPPRSARWIRHYDDVALVYLPTGRVLDVIHDFFL
ncbi:RcnB family protein [Sphingobium sp. BYY-5]|uniref:RcnB family protein n=1 Tax=Sphingobium sp. BYY-5 TaxID=2926400 RepID=UPI001FA7914B|nr:RcnB family protein [Sphingobium sp. BYY-5]MCI4588937.1 RcnB family protein [Sphingobium sp. BYY-5]